MNTYIFKCGEPELRYIPNKLLSEIVNQILKTSNYKSLFGYGSPQGSLKLREEIAKIIAPSRGINCTPDEVMIVSGAQQAFSLLAEYQRIRSNYSCAVIEDPGYNSVKKIVSLKGLKPYYLPVDEEGAIPLENHIPEGSIIFLTPNNQFPTGVTLTTKRREEFLYLAQKKRALIIEDDYQAPFTFIGNPLNPMFCLRNSHEVLYVGSFSKIFAPGIRLAFLIGATKLIKKLTLLRWQYDRHSPQIVEFIISKMIYDGLFSKYETKLYHIYSQRWKILSNAVFNHFGYKTSALGGLSIWIPLNMSWKTFEMALNQQTNDNFLIDSTYQWYSELPKTSAIRLSITKMGCSKINKGVKALAKQLFINQNNV